MRDMNEAAKVYRERLKNSISGFVWTNKWITHSRPMLQ